MLSFACGSVPPLQPMRLVAVRLQAAAFLKLCQLLVGGRAALLEHIQLHGAVVHFLLVVLLQSRAGACLVLMATSRYSSCLSMSAVLGPGNVFVIEVLDPLVQEGMSALMHLRLHILCLFQPLFFLERASRHS